MTRPAQKTRKNLRLPAASLIVICSYTFSVSAGCSPSAYKGEICYTADKNGCPKGFADASGQLMTVAGNESLFSLVGTYYGGNGRTDFGLPNLTERTAIGAGQTTGQYPSQIMRGQLLGSETVTVLTDGVPSHQHDINFSEATFDAKINYSSSIGQYVDSTGRYFGQWPWSNSPAYLPVTDLTEENTTYLNYGMLTVQWSMTDAFVGNVDAPAPSDGPISHIPNQETIDITAPRVVMHACIATGGVYPPRP